jgi:hypothetical protein
MGPSLNSDGEGRWFFAYGYAGLRSELREAQAGREWVGQMGRAGGRVPPDFGGLRRASGDEDLRSTEPLARDLRHRLLFGFQRADRH